jgi:predicted aldo/keto reductase-like oxidoreductase
LGFRQGGIKAAIEAQKEGKVRYIGFTGHKDPRIQLQMLNKPHDWDTVQMPINIMDAHYRSYQKKPPAGLPGTRRRRNRHEELGRWGDSEKH